MSDGAIRTVSPDHEAPEATSDLEGFNGRIPLVYDSPNRTVYLGKPNWYHSETYDHHGLEFGSGYHEGFYGGGPDWGGGNNVRWYNPPAQEDVDHITHAVRQLHPRDGEDVGQGWQDLAAEDDAWN